jgi:hypothetical protein
MFAIIFVWTPPHFWALSLYAHGDYKRAGVPMLPVVAGARETRRQIWLYSLLLVPVSLVPVAIGMSGLAYGGAALVLGGFFLHAMWRVKRDAQDETGVSLTNDAPPAPPSASPSCTCSPCSRPWPPTSWCSAHDARAEDRLRAPPPQPQLGHPGRLAGAGGAVLLRCHGPADPRLTGREGSQAMTVQDPDLARRNRRTATDRGRGGGRHARPRLRLGAALRHLLRRHRL